MHSGIISTIFSTCVIFTSLFFFLFHGQKLSKYDVFGCTLIITCVVLIGLGSEPGDSVKTDLTNLILAIVFAFTTGLIFSINTLDVNYVL